jgi:hypothetical protein
MPDFISSTMAVFFETQNIQLKGAITIPLG